MGMASATPSISLTHTVHMILEMTLLDIYFYKYAPSLLAAAALHVGRQIARLGLLEHEWAVTGIAATEPLWTVELEHYTHYAEATLVPCVRDLACILSRPQSCDPPRVYGEAMAKKYERAAFARVWAVRRRLRGWHVTGTGLLVSTAGDSDSSTEPMPQLRFENWNGE